MKISKQARRLRHGGLGMSGGVVDRARARRREEDGARRTARGGWREEDGARSSIDDGYWDFGIDAGIGWQRDLSFLLQFFFSTRVSFLLSILTETELQG